MTDTSDTGGYRTEHDSMGEVRVPRDALYRAQTQRAVGGRVGWGRKSA